MPNNKEYHKEYYLKNKEKYKQRSKIRRIEKSGEIKTWFDEYHKTKQSRLYKALVGAKQRANKKNIAFNLDIEYISALDSEICPIFGTKFIWDDWGTKNGKPLPTSPSLDRVDPSKGYIKGNVIWVSHKANSIKNNASLEDLLKVAEWLQNLTNESKL